MKFAILLFCGPDLNSLIDQIVKIEKRGLSDLSTVKTAPTFSKRHGSVLRDFPESFRGVHWSARLNSNIPKAQADLAIKGTGNADTTVLFAKDPGSQNRLRKGHMPSTPYDILRRHHDGSFIWMEAASELSHAKDRLQQLYAAMPGEYFVFDQKSQQIVAKISSCLPPGD